MISVAMATYNGEKYIKEQIDSIINQTIKVDEIIVCDDCSSDKTIEIIEENLSSSYIKYKIYRNELNLGVVKTFSKAIDKCNGDIIFLSDQDDLWEKNKVEIITEKFKNDKNLTVINTSYRMINSIGENIKEIKFTEKTKEIKFEDLLKGNISPGCTIAFRKEVKKWINELDEGIYIHDWYINIIGAMIGKCVYYDLPLIKYRIHDRNTIGKNLNNFQIRNKEKRLKGIEKNIIFYNSLKKHVYDEYIKDLDKIIVSTKNRYYYLNKSRKIKLIINYVIYNPYKNIKGIIGDLYCFRKY